jgi:hypothetical protein
LSLRTGFHNTALPAWDYFNLPNRLLNDDNPTNL